MSLMFRHFLLFTIAALLLSHTGCSSGGDGDSAPVSGNTPMNGSKGGCFTTISSVGGSNIAVSGKIEYEDKEYGLSGFTNNTTNYYKAVRYAEVQIVNTADTVTPLASGFTNSSGIYRISSTGFANVTSAYLRVISNTTANTSGKPEVEVRDLSVYKPLYAVSCDSTFAPQAGTSVTTNLSIPISNEAAGAFNLIDVFTSSGEFINSLAGSNPSLLKAYWETGNTDGTWYCTSYDSTYCKLGEGIYVLNDLGASGDTDEYDDDVLWHEYGHFIAAKFSKDDSQGGIHYLDGNDYDLRLAWSEGWGDFFPAAVKSWLNSTNTTLLSTAAGVSASRYIDTYDSSGWSFDISNPPDDPQYPYQYHYSSNEVAVAKVLWNVRNVFGMQSIWDIITSVYFKSFTPRINLEAFWDGWLQRPSAGSEMTTMQSIFANRSIVYSQDSFESQGDGVLNSNRSLTVGMMEEHTLYNSGDVDYVAFDAVSGQPYTITTSSLKNGTDTFITLYNPDQTPTAYSNDNASGQPYTAPFNCSYDQYGNWVCHENGYDTLSSKLSFTASETGKYFVGIASSSNRPLSAGRYGTYTLKITSQ